MKKYKLTVAQLLMLQRIYAYAFDSAHVGTTNSITALVDAFNALNSKTITVEQWLAQYAVIIKGYAAQKKQVRRELADFSYAILKAVYAYAKDTNDDDLATDVKVSLSKLRYCAYHKLIEFLTGAKAKVQPLVPSLGTYNVTQAKFNQWEAMIASLEALMNIPSSAIRDHKTLGQNIDLMMEEAMELTRTVIDGLVSSLMTTDNAYFRGYFNQRIVIETGIHHTRADVTVVDELGQPFVGVTVTVDELTKVVDEATQRTRTFKAVKGTTDINGYCRVEKFEQGNRTITVSGNGVVTKTTALFHFVHGKAVVTMITCEPDFSNLPSAKTQKVKEKAVK